jgi:hypothetical protein
MNNGLSLQQTPKTVHPFLRKGRDGLRSKHFIVMANSDESARIQSIAEMKAGGTG